MRELRLETRLPGDADAAWDVFLDVARWPEWGRLVTAAHGEFEAGYRWRMELVGDEARRVLRPRFVALGPGRRIVFESRFGTRWGARLVHTFTIDDAATLLQTFTVTGALVPLLWRWLEPGMRQFAMLGDDLARRLATPGRARGTRA